MNATNRNEFQVLAKNRLHIAFKDNNDECHLLGYQRGCDLTAGTEDSGKALGDRNGYSFTFTGKEDSLALNMSTATYNSLVT
jgi:hypothetical protein